MYIKKDRVDKHFMCCWIGFHFYRKQDLIKLILFKGVLETKANFSSEQNYYDMDLKNTLGAQGPVVRRVDNFI